MVPPAVEHTHCFVVQGHVTRLATLGSPAFDGQQPAIEVDRGPAELEELAASQSRVHRDEHRRRQMIAEVWQWGQQRLTQFQSLGVGGFVLVKYLV